MSAQLKIAFINNMNGNFFSFGRYLIDQNLDITLFQLDHLPEHFHPSADTNRTSLTEKHINLTGLFTLKKFFIFPFFPLFSKRIHSLKKQLKSYDIIIACGHIEYLEAMNITIDIYIPYGSDFYGAFIENNVFKSKNKLINAYKIWVKRRLKRQRIQALKKARILLFPSNSQKIMDETLIKLERKNLNLLIPHIYKEPFYKDEQWSSLESFDFIAWNHNRISWTDITHLEYTGSNIAIEGYAQFIKKQKKFKNPMLILLEYGTPNEIQKTKELIDNLKISKYVTWKPLLHRKDIMNGITYADIVFSKIKEKNACTGSVNLEIFMNKKIGIGNCFIKGDPNYDKIGITNFPNKHCHAKTATDVCNILLDYEHNPEKYLKKAAENNSWFNQHSGTDTILKYIELFKLLKKHPNKKYENLKKETHKIFSLTQ